MLWYNKSVVGTRRKEHQEGTVLSRRWERKIQRNASKINKQRKRMGLPQVGDSLRVQADVFQGRSVLLPLFLASVAIFFATVYGEVGERDALYWITVILYLLMAVYFFFRRPYLSVSKTELATRKMGRERRVHASEIEQITALKGVSVITLKGKRSKWIFSRYMNWYDTDAINRRLREFAAAHGIPYQSG